MSVLLMDLEPGDSFKIAGVGMVTLEEKTGRRARVKIEVDKSVQVTRLDRKKRA